PVPGAQRSVAAIAGPAVAGILLGFTDAGWCYGLSAFSWVPMLIALAMIRSNRVPSDRRPLALSGLGEGVSFVWSQPVLAVVLALDFGANIFGSARALLPVYARDILFVGAPGLGLLYAATSAGSLAGAVVM